MNPQTRISLPIVTFPPAGSYDTADTSLPITRTRSSTTNVLDCAATSPGAPLAKRNAAVVTVACDELERLRASRAGDCREFSLAVMRGRWWIEYLGQALAAAGLPFHAPLVSESPHDEVVFEWWHRDRKITVYASGRTVEYVRVWGADIFQEMDDGTVEAGTNVSSLWQWLLHRD